MIENGRLMLKKVFKTRIVLALATFVPLLLFFQNCGKTLSIQTTDLSSVSSVETGNNQGQASGSATDGLVSGGNGQGYDGLRAAGFSIQSVQGYQHDLQPVGAYYRWVSGYVCDFGAPTPNMYEKQIILGPQNDVKVNVNLNICAQPQGASFSPVPQEAAPVVQTFAFNSQFMVYQGQILEKDFQSAPNPKGIISYLCKRVDMTDVRSDTGLLIAVRNIPGVIQAWIELSVGQQEQQISGATNLLSYQYVPFKADIALSTSDTVVTYNYGSELPNGSATQPLFSLRISLFNPTVRQVPGSGQTEVSYRGISSVVLDDGTRRDQDLICYKP